MNMQQQETAVIDMAELVQRLDALERKNAEQAATLQQVAAGLETLTESCWGDATPPEDGDTLFTHIKALHLRVTGRLIE